jgi:hypothetical protein
MPVLGWAKLRLGRRLDSGATSGEGTQNLPASSAEDAPPAARNGV